MIRRLPIYFLIDVSESMVGEQLQDVEEGMGQIIRELKTDPQALETVYISILVFAGQAKTLVPLQEIINFYPPRFAIGGGTSLSKALGHLMYELRKNTVKTTAEIKGDWKPIVFLFTDGTPTDDSNAAINEWHTNFKNQAHLVAIAIGDNIDLSILKKLTPDAFMLKDPNRQSFKEFFKWITASIKTSSVSVEKGSTGFELAKNDDIYITKVDTPQYNAPSTWADNTFAVFLAKCQNNKKHYLIKYKKTAQENDLGLGFATMLYRLNGAYQVDNTYFELTDEAATKQTINTDELVGFPHCPCCGNQYGFSTCSCGKVHCTGGEEVSTCPWCGNQGRYGFGGEGQGQDIGRAQG
jgi:uncharacterized protein YegL